MSYGKMREIVTLVRVHHEKDADGFAETRDEVLARVRAYHEQRHGNVNRYRLLPACYLPLRFPDSPQMTKSSEYWTSVI